MLQPAPDKQLPPKIISVAFDTNGDVLVTWSLPNLNRATVRMPYVQWLEGKGLTLGKHLTQMLVDAGLLPAAPGGSVTGP